MSPSLGMDASVDVQVEIPRDSKAGSRNEGSVAGKVSRSTFSWVRNKMY